MIFGDGGGVVFLEFNIEGYGIVDFIYKSDGVG